MRGATCSPKCRVNIGIPRKAESNPQKCVFYACYPYAPRRKHDVRSATSFSGVCLFDRVTIPGRRSRGCAVTPQSRTISSLLWEGNAKQTEESAAHGRNPRCLGSFLLPSSPHIPARSLLRFVSLLFPFSRPPTADSSFALHDRTGLGEFRERRRAQRLLIQFDKRSAAAFLPPFFWLVLCCRQSCSSHGNGETTVRLSSFGVPLAPA